jgi:DNA primase
MVRGGGETQGRGGREGSQCGADEEKPGSGKELKIRLKEEIQMAKSYPISRILGSKKLVFCPLHKDDVPSLSINHQKNLWRCFGCGRRSGNVIQLVMNLEGLDFRDAVRRLIDPG